MKIGQGYSKALTNLVGRDYASSMLPSVEPRRYWRSTSRNQHAIIESYKAKRSLISLSQTCILGRVEWYEL